MLATKVELRCLCLQAMKTVYSQYYETIGEFPDTKFIVTMLEKVSGGGLAEEGEFGGLES